ncbi:MAG: hypothetical protein EHM19_06995 [Candidatus Latescibacterota bacterium]|nr:MAG: hypothetical protein EHM19_06995 [Candidatus Latescibacterota bacterium]
MRWIALVSLVLSIFLAASNAFAGRIFGDIKLDGKPVPAGIVLKIALAPPAGAPGAEPGPAAIVVDSTVTDNFGSYKLTVKEEGKCILTLVYEKQTPTLEVFSYKDPTRYDLILEKKDGTLSLRRK